jgi:hypothetical protein
MFGFTHNADRKLVTDPTQQRERDGSSGCTLKGCRHKISADLAARGVKLSHVTIRKIITGRSPGGTS